MLMMLLWWLLKPVFDFIEGFRTPPRYTYFENGKIVRRED